MAGCNCTKENDLTAYQDLTETLKTQYVSWSPPQIRREAAKIFRPQYRQNAEARGRELSGATEYDGPEFVYSEAGGVRFLYGDGSIGLLEFHERQKRLMPETYSEVQHETSLLIDQAFRNGATTVATSYVETQGQRDIVVMTLDRTTGRGKMRVINTLADHTMPEMQNIVKKNFSHLNATRPAINTFIFSDTHISQEQIQQKVTTPVRQTHVVLKESVNIAKNTIREIQYTVASVDNYIQRSKNDRVKTHRDVMGDSFIHNLRWMFEHKENKKDEVLEAKKHEVNFFSRSSEIAKNTQRKIREKIITSVATLLFVRATGVGIGGAFASLESLVHVPQALLESPKHTRKDKVIKQKYKERSLRQKQTLEKMRIFQMSDGFKKLAKKEQRVFRRKEKPLLVKEKKILQREQRRSIRRKEVLFRKERRSIRKKEKILWEIVRKLVKKGKIFERRSLSKKFQQKEMFIKPVRISKERPTKRQEKRHVIDFSVALVIWFLLHMQISSQPQEGKRHDVSVRKQEKSTKLILKEPAPWMLFAIIWHLAMIREGGMRTVHRQKKAKKQQTHYYPIFLPPAGVIFAFHP